MTAAASASKSKHTKRTGKTAILIICVGIAFLLWLLLKLSNQYTSPVTASIEYNNLPDDQVLVTDLVEEITLDIESTGFKLLIAQLGWVKTHVSIDYSQLDPDDQFIRKDVLREQFEDDLPEGYRIVNIKPGAIPLKFDKKVSKRVPLILQQQITYAEGYGLAEAILFRPDSVTISGPIALIDTITVWQTKLLQFDNLDASKQDKLALQPPAIQSISLSPAVVEYTLPVERYRTKVVDVNIKLLNVPDSLYIKPMTNKVAVSFLVGESNYNNVAADLFEAEIDFSEVSLFETSFAPVQLKDSPYYIKQVTYSPKRVEYMIHLQ